MSTIVCQNIVSCETTTTLKLKVTAPPSAIDLGFLQSIPKESSSYTHPWAKKSPFSRLSAKSLELCTENLGSESGSDIITDDISIFSNPRGNSSFQLNSESKNSDQRAKLTKKPVHEKANYVRKVKSFPPPLTTMSGSSALQVLRHREGGRLIIEAVEAPFRNSYLQAERSDGRLRLCYIGGGEEADDEDECRGEIEVSDESIRDEENEFDREEFEGEMKLEMEMEIEKLERTRCNGNQGFCNNWKPAFWVASS